MDYKKEAQIFLDKELKEYKVKNIARYLKRIKLAEREIKKLKEEIVYLSRLDICPTSTEAICAENTIYSIPK